MVLLGLSVYGASQLRSALSIYDVLADDSYVLKFAALKNKYFEGLDTPLDIVLKTFDYSGA